MGKLEIERRFLVERADYDSFFHPSGIMKNIRQGYIELPNPTTSFRVRITDNKKAEINIKTGSGLIRDENEHEIDLPLGESLMSICHHYLEKWRLKIDGWEIDFFKDPLSGIIIAEKELQSENEEITLPPWIKKGAEVTESLTNLHLARLASELRGTNIPADLTYATSSQKIPRIALVGPPCSGKSGIIKLLRREMPNMRFVPEVASIVMSQLGIKPSEDLVVNRRFQSTIYGTQKILEVTSVQFAATDNKDAVIIDRGTLDNAAYFQGGLPEFLSFLRTTLKNEYSRYDAVIYLHLPSKETFERERLNNPARYEKSYQEIIARHKRLLELWEQHPKFYYVKSYDNWDQKVGEVRSILRTILDESWDASYGR